MNIFKFLKKKKDTPVTHTSFVTTGERSVVRNNIVGFYDPLIWTTDICHRDILNKIGDIIHNPMLEEIISAKKKNPFNLVQMTKGYIEIYNSKEEINHLLTRMSQVRVNGTLENKGDHLEGYVYSEQIYEILNELENSPVESDEYKLFHAVCKLIHQSPYVSLEYDDSKWMKNYGEYLSAIDQQDQFILLGFDSSDLALMHQNTIPFDPEKFIFTIGTYDSETINFASQSTSVTLTGFSKTFILADFTYNDLIRLKQYYDSTKSSISGQVDRVIRFAGSIV